MTFYAKLHINNDPLVMNFRWKAKCKFCVAAVFMFPLRHPKRVPHSRILGFVDCASLYNLINKPN